jgi:AraC-like DNA-binding protein
MADEDSVPLTLLDLSRLPPLERYENWRESISVLFESEWTPSRPGELFEARVAAAHLGQLLIGEAFSRAQAMNRTPAMIKRDGLDHFLLQVYLLGGTSGRWGAQRCSALEIGDVLLLDLAQPVVSRTQDFRCLTLAVPRAMMAARLAAPERYHGCRLPRDSVLGRVLGEHLRTLWQVTGRAGAVDARAMACGLVDLVGAYFRDASVGEIESQPSVALSLRETIRGYIDKHLHRADLSPEELANCFRISRSYLFALFKPLGGVSGYIRQRRLARAHAMLSRPLQGRRVTDVSLMVGFNNAAHFSRAFRERFGVTPREVLEQGCNLRRQGEMALPGDVDRLYERWLRELV